MNGLHAGDRLRKAGDHTGALRVYLEAAQQQHPPSADLCLALARTYARLDDTAEATRWAARTVDAGDDVSTWLAAAHLVNRLTQWNIDDARRSARVALVGSFTTAHLTAILPLAALRSGLALTMWEAPFGQYRQQLLDPYSELYRYRPDVIVIAVHEGELALPFLSANPDDDVRREVARWVGLWDAAARASAARVVQFTFATAPETALGHLGTQMPGARPFMVRMVNAELGRAAGPNVSLLDCERLSALVGKERWTDPRYWHFSKHAVSLEALPFLARHLAAVIGAGLGAGRKCLVLDLDNTLWGGVIAEDGVEGIVVGGDQTGEAFVSFQEYIRTLKEKGVLLAVCSKNNENDAREPFDRHPGMRLRLDDFAMFVANWDPKPENLGRIAKALDLGMDALVFADDNPAECAAVRQACPDVDVVALPADPAQYTRTLAHYLGFETARLSDEDRRRTSQYRGRAEAMALADTVTSLEELWDSLSMSAVIAPFERAQIARIVQLIAKTNQFNLTTRRHGPTQVEAFMADPACVHFSIRLRDRFADHGLVALLIAVQSGAILDIDSWLMSCRVIGRTVEKTMFQHLCESSLARGVTTIRGRYVPSPKNMLVRDLFGELGFTCRRTESGDVWEYDVLRRGAIYNPFIQTNVSHVALEYPGPAAADIPGRLQ
jgi:FkbH-like protein